jgi:serine protease Do
MLAGKEIKKMYKRLVSIVFSVMVVVLMLSTSACSQATVSGQSQLPSPGQTVVTSSIDPVWSPPQKEEQPLLPDIAEVIAKVKPSVVAINVKVVAYDYFNRPTQVEGAGSGWIIDKDGYIVTNNHVVEGADSVTVTLNDGSKFSAAVVKTDPLTDLAVVKIDAHNLPALDIGDSSILEIGDWVVAVGNALGMGISATSGIVSALDVSLSASADQTLYGLIQTDAAINPGNSGGPLVNMAGEVIGIDSIKIAQVGVEGMGYAISINEAMPIIKGLINTGYIVRPWLGIGLATVNKMVASFYNLAVDTGVLVTQVTPGGPADKAGLKAGDVITAIDSEEVASAGDLVQLINSYEVGQKVEITFWRGQTKNSVSLTLGESPPPGS